MPTEILRGETNTSPDYPHANSNVVIVNRAVIGFCTAFQVAKSARDSRLNISVSVLEGQPPLSSSASSRNTDCLRFGHPEPYGPFLLPLGKYSFNLWKAIDEVDPTFRSTTGYRPQSFYLIIKKGCERDGCGGDDVEKTLSNRVKPTEG